MTNRMTAQFFARRFIEDSRMVGDRVSILECVRKAGYSSEDEFWNDFLSEWMEAATGFVSTLENCRPLSESLYGEDNVMSAIEMAYADNEQWFRLNKPPGASIDFLWLKLDPRAAARWLLSKPLRRHLVPPGLAACLGEARAPPEESASTVVRGEKPAKRPRKFGREPKLRDRLVHEMRKMDPRRLSEMLEKEMAAKFHASRFTCRNARNRVLSES
jgi:hypothetical protein